MNSTGSNYELQIVIQEVTGSTRNYLIHHSNEHYAAADDRYLKAGLLLGRVGGGGDLPHSLL